VTALSERASRGPLNAEVRWRDARSFTRVFPRLLHDVWCVISEQRFPLIGRFLVQSAFVRSALVVAVVLFGFAIGGAYSNQMAPRMAIYIAAGVAPLHQLLLLRYLYRRFVERNGRNPQFVTRSSPQADKNFVFTNIILGAFPYLVLAFIFAVIFGKPGH
jgi:hypothetical protein